MTAGKGSRTSPEKENPGCRCKYEIREKGKPRHTEDSINNMIRFFQCGWEVICEWDVEITKLSR